MILHYTNRTEYSVTLPLEIYFELHAKIHSKTLQNGTANLTNNLVMGRADYHKLISQDTKTNKATGGNQIILILICSYVRWNSFLGLSICS